LIDEFTIMGQGKNVLSMQADSARDKFRKIRARFPGQVPLLEFPGALELRQNGREIELVANGEASAIMERLRALGPESLTAESLTLEEVFIATMKGEKKP
jgi:hypothetical protein